MNKIQKFWTKWKRFCCQFDIRECLYLIFLDNYESFSHNYIDWECELFSPFARLWYTVITYELFDMLLLFIFPSHLWFLTKFRSEEVMILRDYWWTYWKKHQETFLVQFSFLTHLIRIGILFTHCLFHPKNEIYVCPFYSMFWVFSYHQKTNWTFTITEMYENIYLRD